MITMEVLNNNHMKKVIDRMKHQLLQGIQNDGAHRNVWLEGPRTYL